MFYNYVKILNLMTLLLAIVLCMILVLSTGIAAFANENVGLQSVACQAATLERVIKNAEGEDVGTLIADIPEGTFLASSSDANIQMDVQADVGADGVLNRVQQQLEANGETGYILNNYVMADVTFYVNGEKQIPQQPITFHVSGTSIDTENVMAFADDRQNTTTLMDADTDENGGLQFTAQPFTSETVVYGIFDVTEAAEEDGTANTANDAAVMPIDNPASGYRISTTQDNVTLTVEHYVGDKKLYRDTTINLTRSKIIDNIAIASNPLTKYLGLGTADLNKYANDSVVIEYNAVVTDLIVNNSVVPGDGKHDFKPATDILYTGTVTLTKTGENSAKLQGAKFVLVDPVNNKYALVKYVPATEKTDTTEAADAYYKVTGWTTSLETAKAEANLIVTDDNGKAVVKGLDDSVAYQFKEIVAPNGYSINQDNAITKWDSTKLANDRQGAASMNDTKLSSLPSTGGIGTTIFTIAGCAIMIAAAGFFFANRKKANR